VEVIYRLIFYKEAQKDIEYWQKSGNKQAIKKISSIVAALKKDPYSKSPGDPEKLRYTDGYSRRIDKKNRITYEINDIAKEVIVFNMRGHYDDK
jgi:toxin YoeB